MGYWQVTIHSIYGADLEAFDTHDEAKAFATQKYKDERVYGTEIKYVTEE